VIFQCIRVVETSQQFEVPAVDGPAVTQYQGEIYTNALHRVRAAEEGAEARFLVGGGRYLDHYERRDDRCWRFARRKIVADWELELPAPQRVEPLLEGVARGQASAEDPSYAFLSLLPRGRP